MKKKIIVSAVLALVLVFSFGTTAFASESYDGIFTHQDQSDESVWISNWGRDINSGITFNNTYVTQYYINCTFVNSSAQRLTTWEITHSGDDIYHIAIGSGQGYLLMKNSGNFNATIHAWGSIS